MAEKWIQSAIKKKGALRSALGAKKGEPIPAKKLAAAAKKASAKASAKRAGRPYPNLIDNMRAARSK